METSAYYYGDGTDNVIHLTKDQADAANKALFEEVVDSQTGEKLYKTNLSRKEMNAYNAAADILNEYLADHEVSWTDQDVPILRPIIE